MMRTVFLSISILAATVTARSPAQPRTVSFHFRDLSLRASLDSLRAWYPVSLIYLDRDVEGKTVSASCSGCSFEDALGAVLAGTSLTWLRIGDQVVLKQVPREPSHPLATLSGTVTDTLSGDGIQDVSLVLRDRERTGEIRRWCSTNEFGFYSLRNLSPGSYVLVVHAIGYRPVEIPLDVAGDRPVQQDLELTEERITLQEVTVEGRRAAGIPAEGLSRGIYIRSAPAEQTQYLLDGTRVYNPSHFGGVLSTFEPEALNEVDRGIVGLPPYYGGRIGGILDLSLREGSRAAFGGTVGTGSLGSSLSVEGPLSEETTFLLSGRRGYPDAQVPSLADHGTPGRLGSTELIAKLGHRLSPGQRLFFSAYVGRDAFTNAVAGAASALSNNFVWGNTAASLRWIGIVSPSVFLQTSAAYTRYSFNLAQLAGGVWPIAQGDRISSEYAIEDMVFRAHAEHYYDESHTVRGGVEMVRHKITGFVSSFSSQAAAFTAPAQPLWELSVYLQDQWRILPRVTAEIGARATMFTGEKRSFSAIEPRFSILVSPSDRTKLFASLFAVNEYLHPYRASGVFLYYPTVFWYPSAEGIEPSTSLQASLGIQRSSEKEQFVFSAETFYQTTQNLHDLPPLPAIPRGAELAGTLLSGTGRSYGLEISVHKRSGDLTGSISYTLSRAEQAFAEIQKGAYLASHYDRRHEIQASVEYRPDDHWLFGVLGLLVSGEAPIDNVVAANAVPTTPGQQAMSAGEFIELNGAKLPGFQRLELKVVYSFTLGKFPGQVAVRLVNGYGLLDPIRWELRQSEDARFAWLAGLNEMKLFPLFPTMGLTFRF